MRKKLPRQILTRPKMGFPVPIGAWLRGPFDHVLDEYVLSSRAMQRGIFNPVFVKEIVARHYAGENHAERLWALINFEIWQRRFFDGEGAQDQERSAIGRLSMALLARRRGVRVDHSGHHAVLYGRHDRLCGLHSSS
jgi:hypothetical protein